MAARPRRHATACRSRRLDKTRIASSGFCLSIAAVAQSKRGVGAIVDLGTFSGPGLAPRRARAYVPSRPAAKRSVLVMFDGQNAFGDEGSFAGGWHSHEAVERMAAARAPVIVAIDHGGAERIAELGAPSSPKLASFVDLVVDQVLPAAHERFALAYGPAAHVVGGSSMGGLAALYMHFRRPEVFGGAIAMSPSLWFGRRQGTTILRFRRARAEPVPVARLARRRRAGGRRAARDRRRGDEPRAPRARMDRERRGRLATRVSRGSARKTRRGLVAAAPPQSAPLRVRAVVR